MPFAANPIKIEQFQSKDGRIAQLVVKLNFPVPVGKHQLKDVRRITSFTSSTISESTSNSGITLPPK